MGKSNKQRKQEIKKKRLQKNAQSSPLFTKDQLLSYTPNYLIDFDITKTKDLSNLSARMQEIINDAYSIFSQYSPPELFSVCTACCVSIEEERALRTLPLSLLPRELIYSYNDSAKAELYNKNEVAYLLPRILELIALNEEIHHSNELNLCWLTETPSEQWTNKEKELLEQFSVQYVNDAFQQAEQTQQIIMLDEILIMFCRAGIHIEPILNYITQSSNFYVIASLAFLISYGEDDSNYISNGFASDCPQINDIFIQWLKQNSIQLQQNADYAIMHPQTLSETPDRIKYYIELGLCKLSEFTHKPL